MERWNWRAWMCVALVGGVVWLLGCDEGEASPEEALSLEAHELVEIASEGSCVVLFAGQTIVAGEVCVSIDNAIDTSAECGADATGALKIQVSAVDGWSLSEVHIAGGDELSDIPMNRKGNPQIGLFPNHSGDISGALEYEASLPLCLFGLDGAQEACAPTSAYIAVHAVVSKAGEDGEIQTETAWGDGDRFVERGSWAEYFSLTLECSGDEEPEPPAEEGCETAFAFGGALGTCFIDADFDADGLDDGFNRWGWSNGPLGPGSYIFDVYAAAGQCDTSKGTRVGALYVNYDGAAAQVYFAMEGGFSMRESHLYVGVEPLQRDGNGAYTVAPGQYDGVHEELGEATFDNYSVGGLSGDIYVVGHAVACGPY